MQGSVLTIGNFDGVHRGHQKLVHSLQEFKRQHSDNLESIVLTFEPHPSLTLSKKAVSRLSSSQEKKIRLQKLGIDRVVEINFNEDLSKISADEFLNRFVFSESPRFIAIGSNFYFGHDREGSPDLVKERAAQKDIQVSIVNPVLSDGEVVSSSRIRALLLDGKINAASRLLGRDFSISGEVVHGEKRGRQLGFPTANVMPQKIGDIDKIIPKNGVYLSSAHFDGRSFASITNVGVKPTFSNKGKVIIETHLLDFDGDLYGKILDVEFRDRIRDEKKFESLAELREQIQKDTEFARSKLSFG